MELTKGEEYRNKAREIVSAHHAEKSELISMLQEIQETYKYLPKEAVFELAEGLGVSAETVYGVATFYAQFSLDPKGKYLVRICDGTACHVKNGGLIYKVVRERFNFKPGKNTTEDGLFTLETVACLGACGISPVMTINDQVYPQMTPDAALNIIYTIMSRETTGEAA